MIRESKNITLNREAMALKAVENIESYTVIIFLARNGRIRAIKFRPKNFGRISFDLGEISPNQQILRLKNGRNSPKSEKIRPKFLGANLNCADSPGSPEKISTVELLLRTYRN
jgi:hypothetical protein